jgi:general secretion pathway protein A
MYEQFYGLKERPFELTPNPRYLFFTRRHQEALSNLQHGIAQRKGVTLVLGPAGTGKTTLIRAALAGYADTPACCVSISNPTMTRGEFVETLARGFNLSDEAAHSKAALLVELEARLRERARENAVTALIVDEAQALTNELLEEVRLLVNMETETEKLLPLVLVGQPELADRLNEPSCCALKQRITLRCELAPLSAGETAQYIATRVRLAGGLPGRLFTREAVDLIRERSGGIPRVISVICDNALLSGFAVGQQPISRKLVMEVCSDFDLGDANAAPDDEGDAAPRSAAPREAVAANVPVVSAHEPASQPSIEASVARPQLFGTFGPSPRSWFSK